MPTRQPTPGPSTFSAQTDPIQLHNTKKRAVSEIPAEDEPRPKKHRKDLEIPSADDKTAIHINSFKDSRKKRRKKKKKSPLTIPEIDQERLTSSHARLREPLPISLASSTTLSETSVPSPVIAAVLVSAQEISGRVASLGPLGEEDEKPAFTSIDKGKGRAVSENPDNHILHPNIISIAGPSQERDTMKVAQAKIAELTAQLEIQKKQLSRYEDNLSHLQQSLTCEICLDLLYKPFALSPCGHVACYMCLVRWFTSVQNGNNVNANPPTEPDNVARLLNSQPAMRGVFLRNRKTCPLCRASITERPAEIWSIKSMVANLIKSKLVDLPSTPPPSAAQTPNGNARVDHHRDPWRNVFPKPRARGFHDRHQPQFYPPPPEHHGEGWDVEVMGMYDAEDGGIYRCLDCMHEIWGGECTSCHRVYAGHARFDQDNDDYDSEDGSDGEYFLGRRLREIWEGYAQNHPNMGWDMDDDDDEEDDDDDHWDGGHGDDDGIWEHDAQPGWGPMNLSDESMSDEESQLDEGESSDSDGDWSSDDDGSDLRDHRNEVINVIDGALGWNYGQRFQARAPRGIAHIEELENLDEDDDAESSHSESHSNSGSEHTRSYGHPHSDEEEGYEDSFIDDNEEDGANGYNIGNRRPRQLQNQHQNIVDLVDTDDESVDHGAMARRLGRAIRLGAGAGVDDGEPPPFTSDGRRNAERRESPIIVDDEQEQDSDSPAIGGGQRRSRIVRRPIVHGDDEEECEVDEVEDEEVRPAGRRSGPRPRRRAPVFVDSDEDSQ